VVYLLLPVEIAAGAMSMVAIYTDYTVLRDTAAQVPKGAAQTEVRPDRACARPASVLYESSGQTGKLNPKSLSVYDERASACPQNDSHFRFILGVRKRTYGT